MLAESMRCSQMRKIEATYRYSGSAARLINKVCTSSLIYGCQNGRKIIDDHMVKLVINGELT